MSVSPASGYTDIVRRFRIFLLVIMRNKLAERVQMSVGCHAAGVGGLVS